MTIEVLGTVDKRPCYLCGYHAEIVQARHEGHKVPMEIIVAHPTGGVPSASPCVAGGLGAPARQLQPGERKWTTR